MPTHITWKPLSDAVRSLASKEDIRTRVDHASIQLARLKVEDFPEYLQEIVIELREKLIDGGETFDVNKDFSDFSDDDLQAISYNFLTLYDQICKLYCS